MKVLARGLLAAAIAASIAWPTLAAPQTTTAAQKPSQVIKVSAKKYDFTPSTITVREGEPVHLEIAATDHDHGFEIGDLKIKLSIKEGKTEAVEFTPDKVGEFEFKC